MAGPPTSVGSTCSDYGTSVTVTVPGLNVTMEIGDAAPPTAPSVYVTVAAFDWVADSTKV